jgi:hypothetical protein
MYFDGEKAISGYCSLKKAVDSPSSLSLMCEEINQREWFFPSLRWLRLSVSNPERC